MMKKTFILAAITALLSSNVVFAEETNSKVTELTKEDFVNILRTDENVIVNFYEDDCEECEELSPVFEEAASKFQGNAKIAKLKCEDGGNFCASYGAFLLPKVRAYKNGNPSKLYSVEEPNTDSLLEFFDRQMLPSARPVNTKEELEQLNNGQDIAGVAYISPDDEESIKEFQSMADMLGSIYNFGYSTNIELAKAESVKEFPSLAIYKPFDDKIELTSGLPSNEVELSKKMALNMMPVLGAVGEVHITPYYMTGLPLVFSFYKGDDMRQKMDDMIRPLAEKYKGQLHLLHADVNRFGSQAKDLELPKNKWPAMAANNLQTDEKYSIDQDKELTSEEIESFLQDVIEKEKAAAIAKREESAIAEKNVRQITRDEFDSVVLDPTKDVLLEVFSPECTHCQQFAPTWVQLNEILKQSNSEAHGVIAVRMDGLHEMLPPSAGFQLEGFPTIKLYKAEKNHAGFKTMESYEGDRSIQDLVQFLNTYTTKKSLRIELAYPDVYAQGVSSHDEL